MPLFGSRPESGSGGTPEPQPPGVSFSRLERAGAEIVRVDGQPWLGILANYFAIVPLMAHGRTSQAEACVKFLADEGFEGARSLLAWQFPPDSGLITTPAEGLTVLPRACELFRTYGLHLWIVCVVDSLHFKINWPGMLNQVGPICFTYRMPMLGGQELPHATQDDRAINWVKAYRPPSDVLYIEASVHAANDTSMALAGGDAIATHIDRSGDQLDQIDRVADAYLPSGQKVIDFEPIRKGTTPADWHARATKCRQRKMASAWHSQAGLEGKVPAGTELENARAFVRGMRGA